MRLHARELRSRSWRLQPPSLYQRRLHFCAQIVEVLQDALGVEVGRFTFVRSDSSWSTSLPTLGCLRGLGAGAPPRLKLAKKNPGTDLRELRRHRMRADAEPDEPSRAYQKHGLWSLAKAMPRKPCVCA
jgi:hypothetical protein